MAAPSFDYGLTLVDIMNGGANLFAAPSLESASSVSLYNDAFGGTGWDTDTNQTAGLYGGRVALTTASSDLSAGLYIWLQAAYSGTNSPVNVDTLPNGGYRILFVDSLGNWARYNYGGNDVFAGDTTPGTYKSRGNIGGVFSLEEGSVFVIDTARTPDAESVTGIDWTDVNDIEVHVKLINTDDTNQYIGRINTATRPIVTAGEVADPANLAYISGLFDSWPNDGDGRRLFVDSPATFAGANGANYMCLYGLDIGDGSTTTYYRETSGQLAIYPSREAQEVDPTGLEGYMAAFNGDPVLIGFGRSIVINQSATDDVEFSNFTFSGADGTTGEYNVIVEGSTSGDCVFLTTSFYRAATITLAHAVSTSCIFDDVYQVEMDGNTAITAGTLRNSASGSNGLVVTSAAADYSSTVMDFRASNSGKDLTLGSGGAGTYIMTGLTVEAGHTMLVHNDSATNAITVQLAAGISTTTSTAGGSITISAPTDDFTITSSETGSTIRIFTTATQTLLDSATGSSLVFTHTGQTVDYTVQKAGFIPQRFTGVTLSGTSSTTINLVASREYDSSHGLTYTTDASWSRSLNELTVPTWGVTAQGVFSLMIDSFIAETALRNTAFNLEMDGAASLYLVEDAEGATDASIENMIEAGVEYLSAAVATTASWSGIKSSGTATGFTGEFQQIDGTTTTDARASGIFNEVIKTYGDASHGNFDYRGHLVLKYQPNGYRESRSDVLSDYGISTLSPILYIVAMEPVAIAAATGDPAITITIVDHTGAPLVVGTKSFDYEVQDGGANSGTNILREINYNLSLDATYQGKDPFNWPEIVGELGSAYDTIQGLVEGVAGDHGFYVSRGGSDHPDFTRFQSNDGTYYTPAVTATASTLGLIANSYIQAINDTALNASDWAATTAYVIGDKALRTTGIGTYPNLLWMRCTTAGTSGGSEPTWDTTPGNTTADGTAVWTTMSILVEDGSQASDWSLNYTDGEEFSSGDTFRVRGMRQNTTTYYEPVEVTGIVSSAGFTAPISQVSWTDVEAWAWDASTITKYAEDGTNIDIDIIGSGSGEKTEMVSWWASILATGSGMWNFWGAYVVESSASIRQEVSVVDVVIEKTSVGNFQFVDNDIRYYRSDFTSPYDTTGNSIFMDYSGVPLVTETGVSGLTTPESNQLFGTALEASLTTLVGTPAVDVSTDIAAVKTVSDAVKVKTDPLTYTVANQVDSNIQSVNDVTVSGTGASGDEWGP